MFSSPEQIKKYLLRDHLAGVRKEMTEHVHGSRADFVFDFVAPERTGVRIYLPTAN
jgi:hypothetical protein